VSGAILRLLPVLPLAALLGGCMTAREAMTARLEFRDAQGALVREVGRGDFMFSGTSLQVQVRQREGERFLVIASDGGSVGKTVEQIQATRVSSGTMVGAVYVPINYGVEGKSQLIFAHNGEVTTTLAPVPKAD